MFKLLIKSLACMLILIASWSCGQKHEAKESSNDINDLSIKNDGWLERANELRNKENSWLVTDCDGMLWTSLYFSSLNVSQGNIFVAEYPDYPGRFARRDINDPCSVSWSRDMGIGLMTYAFFSGDVSLLERHANYGENNYWKMGEPLSDGRVLYTPGMQGLLYTLIKALGGPASTLAYLPDVYPSGFDDYEAHIQVLKIMLRGEAGKILKEADSIPADSESDETLSNEDNQNTIAYKLNISDTMFKRLKEHHEREQYNPFYSVVYHRYKDGDFSEAINLLMNDNAEISHYVRCDDFEKCLLAEKIFTANLIFRWTN